MNAGRNHQLRRRASCLLLLGLTAAALPAGCQTAADPSAESGTLLGAIPGTDEWWAQTGGRAEPGGSEPPGTAPSPAPSPDDGEPVREPAVWSVPVDASEVGVLSAVWGTGPSDVFLVGGTSAKGEVYHFDGAGWAGMEIPAVPLLVWVYGFAPDDVYAVGTVGGAIHYDGKEWTDLDSGTTGDLWGIWGPASDDLWIVGGTVGGGEPVILHYDGRAFTRVPAPENDRNATALFKVWGIGSKVFAVGERGLILQYEGGEWFQVPAGAEADDDFVSLWGTGEDNIVAVGGRSSARVAVYDGQSWNTRAFGAVPGLNAVYMVDAGEAVVGGVNGFAGPLKVETGELITEETGTFETIHALWSDGAGRFYAVGGRFSAPFRGLVLLRTYGDPGLTGAPPVLADLLDETPLIDCNANGTADTDDLAGGNSRDCNGNGVPDECDADADGDGVPDECDTCPGGDDRLDSDGDGVPDACDACPGSNDADDGDGDGVPDGCDVCPGGDDRLDSDADGVPDACDVCPGFADHDDLDGDGVPDGCDACEGDDNADSDGDGVPDCADRCPNDPHKTAPGACGCGRQETDTDGDGVANCNDVCPGSDDHADEDGDGVPNGCDACPGFNDAFDYDGDGVPNACDLGLELGYVVPVDGPYVPLRQGDAFPVYVGFQGLVDVYLSFRATGFEPNAEVEISGRLEWVSPSDPEDCDCCEEYLVRRFADIPRTLDSLGADVNELRDFYRIIRCSPCDVEQVEARWRLTVTDVSDPATTVSITQTVVIDVQDSGCPRGPGGG